MALDNIKLEFTNTFKGTMTAPNGCVKIGNEPGEMRPYNLLFGALGACFYSTFLDIAAKKRETFGKASLEISGRKRVGEVATLEYVFIGMTIHNPCHEEQMKKCAELAAKFCSVYATISKVATIDLDIKFVYD